MQRGAWRAALTNLDLALEADHPDPIGLRLLKVRAWCALHEVPKAVAELDELAHRPDLGSREGEVLLWQADIALARKTDEAGLELVRRALKFPLPPADESYALGLLARTMPEALGHFRRALERDPFHHRANGMMTILLIVQGEMTEAREQATFGRRLFPEDPTFPVLLAAVHAWEGNTAAADAEVERARPQLGEKQVVAVAAMLGLARATRGLGDALSDLDNPPRSLSRSCRSSGPRRTPSRPWKHSGNRANRMGPRELSSSPSHRSSTSR